MWRPVNIHRFKNVIIYGKYQTANSIITKQWIKLKIRIRVIPAPIKKEKDKFEQQIEELTDRLKRNMAEFDNFRKRTEKEKSSMYVIGAKDIIEKILPVVDNFERGLAAVPEEEKDSPFADGMTKIYKQMMAELDAVGVKPIDCIGQEFDPDFHNAVMQVENDELESGTVAQELQKGYMYKDTVVRHSMVSVVQ